MKKRTYILLLLSTSVMIILGGILSYGLVSVVSLKDESATLRGGLESWIRRSRDSSKLQEILTQAKKVRSEMDEYKFDASEENQIAFISEIESIIKKTGSQGEVKSLDVATDYSKMICSVSILGSWNDVNHTMLALESYPIRINLDDVSIVEEKAVDIDDKAEKHNIQIPLYRANIKFTITSISKPK